MSVWNNPQPNDSYFAAAILANELLDPADVGSCLEKLLCHNFSRNKEVAATQSKDFVRRWADACQQFEKVPRGQDQNWDWEDEAEVKEALLHIDRSVQLGHAAREGSDSILTIVHSPDTDQAWISAILAIRLPIYPKLRIQLISEFSGELVRSVMAGDLNLALVTAPPENSRITAAALVQTCLYAALPQTHAAAQKKTSRSKIWQRMTGFCLLDELTQLLTQSWRQRDARESLRNTRTTFIQPNRRFTWYLNTLAWPFSQNPSLPLVPKV